FVVTVNRNIGFFSNSARYYFILRAFVREHYVLAARFGRYDVLVRRELADGPPVIDDYTPAVDGLVASLTEPLHEPRRAAVRKFLDQAGSEEGVAWLAATAAPDERSRLLLMRGFGETPDLRTIPFLVRTFESGGWRIRYQSGLALNLVALYAAEHRYLLGRLPGERDPTPADLVGLMDLGTARRWLADVRQRRTMGVFAEWLLAGA